MILKFHAFITKLGNLRYKMHGRNKLFVNNINFPKKIIPGQDNPLLWGKFRSIAVDKNLTFFPSV